NNNNNNNNKENNITSTVEWTSEQLDRAHDLMFLDASTTMMHLIPLVSRSDDTHCANCDKYSDSLVRCGSCRSIYYCSAECQRAHWRTAHSTACVSYKKLVESSNLLLQQQQQEQKKKKNKKNKNKNNSTLEVPEVPLEPSLFFTTRRYMYVHRDASFADVSFDDYFMKYTVRGV
ncbi:MYND zinc finger (ZnF) domain-like protein, partial [Trypanosoma theileri]